jgi:hypothetical protein
MSIKTLWIESLGAYTKSSTNKPGLEPMQEHWQQIAVPYQPDQTFPVDLLVREFGVWTLGLSLAQGQPGPSPSNRPRALGLQA